MGDPERPDIMRLTGLRDGEATLVTRLVLFRNVEPGMIADLLQGARVVTYDRGDTLFTRGDPADRLFAVVDGWVKLTRTTPDGQESVIGVFGRGQSFAEAAIFQGGRYPVNGVSVERTRLLVIPAQMFLKKLRRHPETMLNMLTAMSRHLHDLVQQVEQLSTRTTVERVAVFLLALAAPDATDVEVPLPLDKALIAGRLGMRPETFSRALARLRAQGVEEVSGVVRVSDLARLRGLARGEIRSWASGARTGPVHELRPR